ncbi:MAG: class I SAM-dependent methyltransferase [Chloroflexota bacterium]|nr:methyltransferase domain-containing protein [Dehalococcoidia bacterium]MDW8254132.1 class I SAM-dependent methyltransferase [Chloroflexota bacterium]
MNASPARASRRNLRKHTSGNPLQQWLLRRFHAAVADLIAEALPQGGSVLDVGCGEGFVAAYLTARLEQLWLVGLDASAAALRYANDQTQLRRFLQGDAAALPVADRSVDLVIALEVLEHLPSPEWALCELRRVSRGPVIVSTPNQPFFAGANLARLKNLRTWGDDPEHLHWWTAGAFARLVDAYLQVERVVLRFPWTIVLARHA